VTKRNTKELILATSLALFNDLGEPNVTTNYIADEADISPGNLYYHFRSKDDIVIQLFKRFLTELQPLTEVPENSTLEAEDLWFQLHLTFEIKGRFRFLYRNLSDLTARITDLDRAMRGLLMRERRAAFNLISGLELKGSLQISVLEKELLVDTILLVITYWIPFSSIFELHRLEDGTAQIKAIARVLQLVTPFLREPEHGQFTKLTFEYLEQTRQSPNKL
jgi:AcrR family transcriptional regulator